MTGDRHDRLGGLLKIAAVALAACWVGCGPRISDEELGEVIFEVPKVPGAEEPFSLPEPVTTDGA